MEKLMEQPAVNTVELAPDGYTLINRHIERLEQFVNEGISNPEKALESCRKIRAELYDILQTLRNICVVKPLEKEGN